MGQPKRDLVQGRFARVATKGLKTDYPNTDGIIGKRELRQGIAPNSLSESAAAYSLVWLL